MTHGQSAPYSRFVPDVLHSFIFCGLYTDNESRHLSVVSGTEVAAACGQQSLACAIIVPDIIVVSAHKLSPTDPATLPARFALWELGFRPLYLLAGLFATISMPVWTAQFAGWLDGYAIVAGPRWHAHEMIFGYTFAVIVGFLFTAVRNWTDQPTPAGATLALIVAVWLAARVLAHTPYTLVAAAFDTLFALAAAIGIAIPLLRSANRRNYFFIFLLLGMGLANLIFYLGMAALIKVPLQVYLQAGLDIVLLVMVVMGGRVIPMFTTNGVPGATCSRLPWIEKLAPATVIALLFADVLGAPQLVIAPVAATAAAVHALRLVLWRPWQTLRTPIVWILHCAYGWIVIALALRALSVWELAPASLATHALTIGGIGALTLGMMTRTSRGHTARPLKAGQAEIFSYVAVQLAAVSRVLVPLIIPALYPQSVIVSGVLWSAAFGVFTVSYWPILSRPRLDGKPG